MPNAAAALNPDIRNLLATHARGMSCPAGTVLLEPGMACEHFLVLSEGRILVRMLSAGGREIVLHRIGPGETCILTSACLLGQDSFPAQAVAETDCTGAILSRDMFHEQMARSDAFRQFVFKAYGQRLQAMMAVMDDVIFQRLDIRLATFLTRQGDDCLRLTHQAIADELGTAREVVSRHLKEMEIRGWINQQRGTVVIQDRAALARFVAAV